MKATLGLDLPIHQMNLHTAPFDLILSGEKIYELRLYDERRKVLKVGDFIEFDETNGHRKLVVQIEDIMHFANFAELYASLPFDKIGYKSDEKADPSDMDIYYSKEKQRMYGVIAIKVRLI